MSENATPATEFAPCHHLTQPCQCDLQKTRNRTRLKCCACHEKWRWTRPKCCACHENCNTSSENVTKVLRLPRKTIFNTLQNTSECHEVPRLPRETKQRHVWNLQNDHLCRTSHRHGHTGIARTVADGCERLRPWTQRRANTPSTPRPPEWNGNPCYAFGNKNDAAMCVIYIYIYSLLSVSTGLSHGFHTTSDNLDRWLKSVPWSVNAQKKFPRHPAPPVSANDLPRDCALGCFQIIICCAAVLQITSTAGRAGVDHTSLCIPVLVPGLKAFSQTCGAQFPLKMWQCGYSFNEMFPSLNILAIAGLTYLSDRMW